MIDFAGQAVIVTGAGRGLGRLYASEFLRSIEPDLVVPIVASTTATGSP
jgi:NAD(P)-dependent dehydrogenase (short-subunit alcohol dehydrogenase family)